MCKKNIPFDVQSFPQVKRRFGSFGQGVMCTTSFGCVYMPLQTISLVSSTKSNKCSSFCSLTAHVPTTKRWFSSSPMIASTQRALKKGEHKECCFFTYRMFQSVVDTLSIIHFDSLVVKLCHKILDISSLKF